MELGGVSPINPVIKKKDINKETLVYNNQQYNMIMNSYKNSSPKIPQNPSRNNKTLDINDFISKKDAETNTKN